MCELLTKKRKDQNTSKPQFFILKPERDLRALSSLAAEHAQRSAR
jgi:hypothetical protein